MLHQRNAISRQLAKTGWLSFELLSGSNDNWTAGVKRWKNGLFALVGLVLMASTVASGQDISQLKTVAENSQFTATGLEAEVTDYLQQIAAASPVARLENLGETVEGRPIWGLILDQTVADDDADLLATKSDLTVLLLGGIHSGECDGKEALLAMARDLLAPDQLDWWKSLRILFVPNFSVDAGERHGRLHRPGQVGPDDGMGLRENAQGLDLNRDFVKLETPEVNTLVAALHRFDVDLFIDTHTTNGSMHRYDLTYDVPHNPAVSEGLVDFMRQKMMPAISADMKTEGFNTFYYGDFQRQHTRWVTFGHEPRYSTEYVGMLGKLAILSESYSYVDYKRRIDVTYSLVKNSLKFAVENSQAINELFESSEPPAVGEELPIKAELAAWPDMEVLEGYRRTSTGEPAEPKFAADVQTSVAMHLEGLEPADFKVQVWTKFDPTLQIKIPTAYLIPRDHSWVVDRLARHNIKVEQLTNTAEVKVETYKIDGVQQAETPFQGHKLLSPNVSSELVTQSFPAGTYYISTQQPLGRLAAYILEPHSDDSLAKWNFFDPVMVAGQSYPVVRLMDNSVKVAVETVKQVKPSETLTLDKIFSPDQPVDFDGTIQPAPKFLPSQPNQVPRYVVDNKTIVAAATGEKLGRYEPGADMAKALAKVDGIDARTAQTLAEKQPIEVGKSFALVQHKRDLILYDAAANSAKPITSTPDIDETLADISPTGNYAAFVHSGNLYVVDCKSAETKQLTHDTSKDHLNGILDWVYQEEVYGRGNFKAFWWSPSGDRIAFLRLDETPVDRFDVPNSIQFAQTREETRYPKAGAPNPNVQLMIADAATGDIREIDLSAYAPIDRLVVRVEWSPSGERLLFQVQNRIQTWLALCSVGATETKPELLFRETSPGWVEVIEQPRWLKNGDFLWVSDSPSGRRHVFRISSDGKTRQALTSGDWNVTSIVAITGDDAELWVDGNYGDPLQLHLVRIDLKGANNSAESVVATPVTSQPGTHRTKVDDSGQFIIDSFSNISTPTQVRLLDRDGKLLRMLCITASDRYKFVNIQPPQLIKIPARDGLDLPAMIIAPSELDLASQTDKKYPVLFYIYGGPQNPTISNSWQDRNYWWHQYLAQQGYVVVLCDNRSSRGRGLEDTWKIHRNLAAVELQDLTDAVEWVKKQTWSNPDRIGLWGWSYGGYFTSFAMTHTNLFRAGIAGAPVTDWRNYDSIYTERYMDTPQNNPKGYQDSSVVEAADQLSGRLLLLHGERDDNVHLANTLQFAQRLQYAGKQFDMMIYPENRHSVSESRQKRQMFELMTEFLDRYLKGQPKE